MVKTAGFSHQKTDLGQIQALKSPETPFLACFYLFFRSQSQ